MGRSRGSLGARMGPRAQAARAGRAVIRPPQRAGSPARGPVPASSTWRGNLTVKALPCQRRVAADGGERPAQVVGCGRQELVTHLHGRVGLAARDARAAAGPLPGPGPAGGPGTARPARRVRPSPPTARRRAGDVEYRRTPSRPGCRWYAGSGSQRPCAGPRRRSPHGAGSPSRWRSGIHSGCPLAQTRPGSPTPRSRRVWRSCRSNALRSWSGLCQMATHQRVPALVQTPQRAAGPGQVAADAGQQRRAGLLERGRSGQGARRLVRLLDAPLAAWVTSRWSASSTASTPRPTRPVLSASQAAAGRPGGCCSSH